MGKVCLLAAANTLLYGKGQKEPFPLSKPAELLAADVQSQLDSAAVEDARLALLALLALDESTGWPAARCQSLE